MRGRGRQTDTTRPGHRGRLPIGAGIAILVTAAGLMLGALPASAAGPDPAQVARPALLLPPASITTTAADTDSSLAAMVVDGATITVTVDYQGLPPGVGYTASAEFHSVADGTSVGLTGSADFTPASPDGVTSLTVTVPTGFVAAHAGLSIVAYTTVTPTGETTPVAQQQGPDPASTLVVPRFSIDVGSGNPALDRNLGDSALQDTITYSGLTPGLTYTVTAQLARIEKDGTLTPVPTEATTDFLDMVTHTWTFTPQAADGVFSRLLWMTEFGAEYVLQQTVSVAGHTIATSGDPTDPNQIVYVTALQTAARNGTAALGPVLTAGTVVDTITYHGLQPGKTYVMTGSLNYAYNDGPPQSIMIAYYPTGITQSRTFTPSTPDGQMTMTYAVSQALVDASHGRYVVADVTVTIGGVLMLAESARQPFLDEAQAMVWPMVAGSITNKIPALGRTAAPGTTLVDSLTYFLGLGHTYTITGSLEVVVPGHDPVPTGIARTIDVAPSVNDGDFTQGSTATMVLPLPADLGARFGGQTLRVFFTVKQDGVTTLTLPVAASDPGQTVFVPAVESLLHGPGGARGPVDAHAGVTLTDSVSYSGLIPGQKYVLTGSLRWKDGAGTGVSGSASFTAAGAAGTVDVRYVVPGTLLATGSGEVVASESLALAAAPATPLAVDDVGAANQALTLDFGSAASSLASSSVAPSSGVGGLIDSGEGASGTHRNATLVSAGALLLLFAAAGAAATRNRRRRRA
jgi:hypothetical protein